jgi:preprotein translocase subunit SecE
MSALIQYLRETRAELDHITWPTRKQTLIFTVLVVLFSVFVGVYLGLLDFGFARLLDMYVV